MFLGIEDLTGRNEGGLEEGADVHQCLSESLRNGSRIREQSLASSLLCYGFGADTVIENKKRSENFLPEFQPSVTSEGSR